MVSPLLAPPSPSHDDNGLRWLARAERFCSTSGGGCLRHVGAAWLGEPLRRRCLLIGTLSQPSSRLLLPTTLHPHPIQVHSFTSPPASPHTESSAFSSRSQVQTVPSPGSSCPAGAGVTHPGSSCVFLLFTQVPYSISP